MASTESGLSTDVDDDRLLAILEAASDAIENAVYGLSAADRRLRGDGHGDQFAFDVVADNAATAVLLDAGLGVLSEESGLLCPERPIRVVLDPIDGSTNLSRGLDPYGPSLCAFDNRGPRIGLVANLATSVRYVAVRGAGSWRDGRRMVAAPSDGLSLVVTGDPVPDIPSPVWARVSGASAHDLCRVADGTFDAYFDHLNRVSIWDYAAGALVVTEAGGIVADRDGRTLYRQDSVADTRLMAAGSAAHFGELSRLLASLTCVGGTLDGLA